ncbi:hypothetical protein BABINDRAFT_100775 [Babjeviella inositovora NRRL Y-12698]|uniref:Uncharacterized protein n=1 Tax=Babjeviella inositovora NRRL Y-12698 TaxID=984486 RepID=A0A1E3QI61_9ASCO|nr:uncharacterized protein BABINDRAFT_100775 [Babjeviella inositovora NRRL Y-12698]ODQ77379.1 hypothetical protein BABINDRAFT_100775 [Babjeviella inositovora NRRL Y-12698]
MKERFQKCLPGILADSKNEYILQKHPYVFAYDDYLSIIEETLAEKFEFKDNRENQVREGSSRSTANTFSAAYVASRDTDRDSTVSFEFDAEDAKLEDPIEYELSNGTDTVKPETRAKLLHLKTNMQILELISRTIKFQDNTPAIKWSNKAVSTFLRNMVMESMKTNEYELSELAHRLREALNGSDDELSGNGREYEMRTLV